MKKYWPILIVTQLLAVVAIRSDAGTIFYQAIPASQSDANSGISTEYGYTSAVDGGNTRGPDRVINGITLSALVVDGQTATADNCTLNALAGSLSNAGGGSPSVQADGVMKDAVSDMTFNNGAPDNSQQEIVLDPESLEEGTTYDLRIYVCNSAGQNRQVNLAFVGDGQPAVETGVFNEDDARTSAGGFKDANQAYYINYRFTWDGDSTPGVTITQKSGGAPFVLYALTNQVVPGAAAGSQASDDQGSGGGGAADGQAVAQGGQSGQSGQGDQGDQSGEGGDEGLSSGFVEGEGESDEVGVESDDFYGSDSLNSNGKWVNVDKWGKCWQPTGVSVGWTPYTNGNFQNCDDCGATFVSDEPWAWATYHYGRWCKVSYGCGWAWVPGKVWAGSWVSWRRGRTESCECIGWAPLPPEAGCEIDVGISSWVDETCNIGPECYTFVNVVDFGRDSYFGCGCIYDRGRNTTVIIDTFNCTNICNTRRGTFCGGVDFNWCNEKIRKHGGKECENVHVNRYDDPKKLGGKFSKKEGNQLGLMSPHVKNDKNHKINPKVADNIKGDKIDHGWGKDKKAEKNLRNHIAGENKGKNPKNTKATLPSDVAKKMDKKHGGGGGQGLAGAGGGKGQHPGGKGKKGLNNAQNLTGGQTGAGAGGFNQHPGGKGKGGKGKGQGTAGAGAGAGAGGKTGFNQHPGGGKGKGKNQKTLGGNALAGNQGAGAGGGGNAGKGRHPGQSFKKGSQGGTGQGMAGAGAGQGGGGKNKGKGKFGGQATGQGGTGQGMAGATGQGGTTGQGGGKHKGKGQTGGGTGFAGATGQGGTTGQGGGKHKGKGKTGGQTTAGQGFAGATGQGGTAGQGAKHKSKGKTGGGTGQGFAGATGQGGTTGQGGGGKHKNKAGGGTRQGFAGATGQGGTTGQGGGGKHKNKGQTGFAGATGQGGTTGQGGGGKHKNQQFQQQQHVQKQHVQQQHVQQQQMQQQHFKQQGGGGGGGGRAAGGGGGGGGGGKKKKPTPIPSDLRLKKNVSFVRWSPTGVPIYQFSYINQPNKRYQGTIAQAITNIRPDAVVWQNGFMLVDYSRLDVEMEELPSP